jgi:hypothetical protein
LLISARFDLVSSAPTNCAGRWENRDRRFFPRKNYLLPKYFLRVVITKLPPLENIFESYNQKGLAQMNAKEVAHYKRAAFDLVSKVQELRRERLELDDRVAAAFRDGRANGIDRRSIKEVLDELNGGASDAETVWRKYAAKIGLTDADMAGDDNPLDRIFDAHSNV